ncbi:MAG: protein-methionine-sulfoxide reductase heme-binding subunit MsrQ [Pseudomonadota bacterium]
MKPLTFLLSLAPFAYSVWQIYLLQSGGSHSLGADPGKELLLFQGEWAIRFLVLTLLITPLRISFGWNQLQSIRRMLGLFTFFYASLHLLAYVIFLLELDFSRIEEDLRERPFISVGFLAWLLLLPLAITSTNWMVRRLKKNWVKLHRLAYLVAALAVVHVFWLARSSYTEAIVYGTLFAGLLAFRPVKNRVLLLRQSLRAAS